MSGIYPVFEQVLPTADNFNGKGLSGDLDKLDDLADRLGLITLSEFIDARSMALEVLEEDQLPANCPPVRWFSAREGLATVHGLLVCLEQHPELLSQSRTWIIEDSKQLATLLHEAKGQTIRFHLMVDI